MPYMTPESIPENTVCFLIQVPDDINLKSAFFGALYDLTLQYNWETSEGGLTPQETVNFTVDWYQEIVESGCMNICSDIVAGCLTNPDFNEDLFDALLPSGVGSGGGGSSLPLDAIGSYDIGGLPVDCNDADKYGACFSIVNQLNIVARDLLQIVELASNAVEAASELIEAIPVFGGLLSAVVETVDWIQEYMDEAYNAFFNVARHEELACAIFCEMDDCTLTIDDIRTAFRTILLDQTPPSPSTPFPVFIAWMTPLVTTLTPLQVITIVQLFVVEVLVRGSRFLGTSYRVLEIAGALSSPIAPPEGCGCVDEQCYTVLFGTDNLDGTWSSENSGLSTPHRVQIEWSNFSIGSNEWQFGTIVSGAVNGSPAVRVWEGGAFSGTINETLTYAGALLATPIEGGAVAIISNNPFTINFTKSDGSPECP